jgi:hypothetical protein
MTAMLTVSMPLGAKDLCDEPCKMSCWCHLELEGISKRYSLITYYCTALLRIHRVKRAGSMTLLVVSISH